MKSHMGWTVNISCYERYGCVETRHMILPACRFIGSYTIKNGNIRKQVSPQEDNDIHLSLLELDVLVSSLLFTSLPFILSQASLLVSFLNGNICSIGRLVQQIYHWSLPKILVCESLTHSSNSLNNEILFLGNHV